MQMPLGKQQPIIVGMLDQPPTGLTNRYCKLVSDQASILFGSTSRRHRLPKL